MNPRSLVATAINTHLSSNPALVGKLTAPDGELKIYLGTAPGDIDPPYVLINHVFGGHKYRTPRKELDALWSVAAVADNQPDAEDIASLLYDTLEGQRIDMPDGWAMDQDISHTGDIGEKDVSQGEETWKVGCYFRIRACKNAS